MRGFLKEFIISFLVCLIGITEKILHLLGVKHSMRGDVFDRLLAYTSTVSTPSGPITFHTPNSLATYRAESLLAKEPETIAWIDGFEDGSVLWDIGANVGVYSLYAARRHSGIRIFAFEPSIENTYLLNRNISENGFQERITALPVAVSEYQGFQLFQHQRVQLGGALSSFGVDYSFDGKRRNFSASYRVFGISGDGAQKVFGIPAPNYIKIDVDGIEHLIARGMRKVFSEPSVKQVMIELNFGFQEQRDEVIRICEECGLRLDGYRHADAFYGSGEMSGIYNHFFIRT